jgi:hypothetical protein
MIRPGVLPGQKKSNKENLIYIGESRNPALGAGRKEFYMPGVQPGQKRHIALKGFMFKKLKARDVSFNFLLHGIRPLIKN